jgi:hypothetical protein
VVIQTKVPLCCGEGFFSVLRCVLRRGKVLPFAPYDSCLVILHPKAELRTIALEPILIAVVFKMNKDAQLLPNTPKISNI